MSPEVVMLIIRVLLALVLYAFFGMAIAVLWRSAPRRIVAEDDVPQAYAVQYQEERLVESHRLRALNLIGRAADNTILLADERVSAHHAKLIYSGGQWVLEDLASRNGTFVNELPLEGPLVVTYEDRIQIGAVVLHIEAERPLGEATFT
ncbi:MAG: FHA domain-containing protein [Anaerolineales bacterium]|nr:MAG: FHA domain-containing protein [Anaerolineales bacterium]